jgi:hypothetical protein
MPAHQPGESIEGMRIHGHSRDPLRYQRKAVVNGIKCFIFKAEKNVVAKISISLAGNIRKLDKNALTAADETLGCNTAILTTVAKTRTPRERDLFQAPASHITSTHGANIWESKQQTNVKVVTPRQEIINGVWNRIVQVQYRTIDS